MLAQYWPEFLSLALVHFLAVILPGPDFAITVRQSMRYGHVIGCLTALGIGLGISVHVLYTLIGIGLFIQKHEWLMFAFKIAGAAYLCYLGWTLLKSQGSAQSATLEEDVTSKGSMTKLKALSTGFMTNALNPKATVFFLAIFTSLVSAQTPLKIQIFYGVWMCMINAVWFIFVSLLFSQTKIRQGFLKQASLIERGIGLVLLGMACKLVFTSI